MNSRVNLVALAVAVIALIVAAYAVASIPKSNTHGNNTAVVTTTVVASSPPPNVTVSLRDSLTVDWVGLNKVVLGWIHTTRPCIVELRGVGDYEIWFLVDNKYYGNPAVVVLDSGNHTIGAYINALGPGKINISYRVVG
jgi:hypothetical protein